MTCYTKGMEFLTVQEAASKLSVSPKAVYYALTERKLTRHEMFGRVVLDSAEVEAYRPRAGAGRLQPAEPVGRPRRRRSGDPDGSTFTTQAALAGPIAEIWDTPEEDEAWRDL